MADWIRVAALDECPPGSAREIVVGEDIVALFNVRGQLCALDGIYPHQGGPLGQGTLSGQVVTCPWHGWQFDVCTGQHQVNPDLRHARWDVKVEGQEVLVRQAVTPIEDGS